MQFLLAEHLGLGNEKEEELIQAVKYQRHKVTERRKRVATHVCTRPPLLADAAAKIIQRFYRTYKAKVRFTEMLEQYKKTEEGIRHHRRCLAQKEIIISEESYVSSLKAIVNNYIQPLRGLLQKGVTWISSDDITILFMNVEQLLMLHQMVLLNMQSLLHNHGLPYVRFGSFFMQQSLLFFAYVQYINMYDTAMQRLNKLMKKSQFTTFCTKARRQSSGLTLESLLIMPVQRLPRYQLLLHEIFKHTPTTHREYASLKEAISRAMEITTYINQLKAKNVTRQMKKNVMRYCSRVGALKNQIGEQEFIQQKTAKYCLVDVHRGYGSKPEMKEVELFVFEKLIIICKHGSSSESYHYEHHLPLQRGVTRVLSEEEEEDETIRSVQRSFMNEDTIYLREPSQLCCLQLQFGCNTFKEFIQNAINSRLKKVVEESPTSGTSNLFRIYKQVFT